MGISQPSRGDRYVQVGHREIFVSSFIGNLYYIHAINLLEMHPNITILKKPMCFSRKAYPKKRVAFMHDKHNKMST